MELFDVEEISTHGGSLRIYAKHKKDGSRKISESVNSLLQKEKNRGIASMNYYDNFQHKALQVKLDFIEFLTREKRKGSKVAAYGAAAKGNTLLNYCGIKSDLVEYVVDANPAKQDKFLPGSHIPVVNEQYLKNDRPDYVIIFPWNIKAEVIQQLAYIREWNGKFVIPIPGLELI